MRSRTGASRRCACRVNAVEPRGLPAHRSRASPPIDALTSCRRKVERAGEHLLPVLEEVLRFGSNDSYSIADDYDAHTRRQSFKIAQRHFPSVEMGLFAGDFVHNLRSALDHLAFGLVGQNRRARIPRRDRRDIRFPISDTYRGFMSERVIPHLTLPQIAVIESYQSFARGDDYLLDLNSLWNADKHQILQPVLAALPQSGIKLRPNLDAGAITDRDFPAKITFYPEARRIWQPLGWVEVTAPGPNPHVEVESLTVDITLGERPIPVERLDEIGSFVNDIIEECAQFF